MKQAMGIWESMVSAEGGIKGPLLGHFLKEIPFSSVLNTIRAAVSDPDKKNQIAGTTWKLPNGHLLGLFLNQIPFSSVLNIIRPAVSDPDNKNRIAVTMETSRSCPRVRHLKLHRWDPGL